jgi:hypothetical protein
MPVTKVGPDQRTYQFPDGTTPEQMDTYFRSKAGTPSTTAQSPRTGIGRLLTPANEAENLPKYDPNTLRGYGLRTVEALKGMGASVGAMFDPHSIPGTKGNPVIWNPATQVKKDWQGIKDWNDLRKINSDYAWGSVLAPMLLTHTLSSLMEPAGITAKLARGAGVDPAYIEPVVADLREAAKGVKPTTVKEFVDVANGAQKTLNDEYGKSLGKFANHKSNLPDPDGRFPISQAIKALKNKMPAITDADRSERSFIDKAASEYEKPITLGELDLKRMQANNRLSAYYDKNDVSQYAAESRNAQIAVDKAVADWVRDNVYPDMDQLTGKQPGYFRNLKSRVGNLMNASSQAIEFATKVHQESAFERGSTPMERIHPGGAISMRGSAHGYISNLPAVLRPPDPEAGANAAVKSAFGLRQQIPPPPEVLSMPLSAIIGGAGAADPKKGVAAALTPP